MPSLLQNASSNAFDSSILTLQATFSSGMTLLTTASTANNFLRATDGPFAELKELIAQHTSIKDRPQFQPLVPPDQIVKGIVQKIWGHSSIETVGDIGDILEKGLVTDDLSLEVFLEACIAGYAQKKGKSPQEVMKRFRLHNPTEAGQMAWQTWLKLHPPVWLRYTEPWPLPSRNLGPESEHSETPDSLRYPDGPPTSRDMPLNHSSTHFIYWSHPTSFGYATPLSELPASFARLPSTTIQSANPLYPFVFPIHFPASNSALLGPTPRFPVLDIVRNLSQQDIDRKYPDQAEEAKAFYDKILIHCRDLVLSKDEREAQPNEGLYLLQKITRKYAAQLAALSSIHPVGVVLVGFIADDKLAPWDSTIAFTSSPMIAEMVKAMGLPLTEDSALAMRNFYDGIKAFSPYQPNTIKQRTFLQHLGVFTNPNKSTSKVFGASSLMKTIMMHMKQSVHFSNDLDRYLGNGTGNTAIKSEVEGDANDMDYHTPALKRKEGLAFADKTYSSHPQCHTELEATGITELGHNWRVANILSFMLEHRLRFVGWHRGVPHLNKSLPCDWTPRESARCIMQLTHQDPEQMLRVEQMTDGEENLTGLGLPDEYLMHEVLHYAPDAKGNITKYLLPEHETRRAIVRTAVVPHEPKNQCKKSKATRTRTLTKAKPPRVTPGGHNQMNEAAVPENEVKGPQDDGIVPETPPHNSPEPGGSSSSSVKLEAINLTMFPSGVCSGFQQGCGLKLPDDPETTSSWSKPFRNHICQWSSLQLGSSIQHRIVLPSKFNQC
ncbi:uncharacterized protein EI90DRAFT_3013741 [Cantharellus anzutake]|uniref:uncharacterized protein n=1 Tax=Cantharellus anzutake TaxID=1750568 RepID=UPI001908365C|nr:uncharacterized protein EI90DRAFT_3013741 [Cantharellus anzutake]KAF8337548.1 hypothetical protein EI90DRAFT_3013741 [Cantharellus anzutake]